MIRKELIKQLIVDFQESLPINILNREISLPVDSDKIITVPGVRRCGKSSLLYNLINKLTTQHNIDKTKILFFNFDDERLYFNRDNIDEIIQSYRELYPYNDLKDIYIFFDEIQMAEGWETFVRRIYEQQCKHIFITGSNSRMLSSELSTTLRGRCLQYEEFPLSFNEYCSFLSISTNYHKSSNKAILLNAFRNFLNKGAFPEIVLGKQIYTEKILQEYYYVMLYKDMIERYNINNIHSVKFFIKRIFSNITKPTSINKIYNELKSQGVSVSKNSLYEWIEYTKAIYLFFSLPKFEPSLVKQSMADSKYYCIDNGLWSILINTISEENGKRLENAVFLYLRRNTTLATHLSYYKGTKECDFVVSHLDNVSSLIQVSWTLSDSITREREIAGIVEASKATGCTSRLYILTFDEEEIIHKNGLEITVMPAWKYFLIQS